MIHPIRRYAPHARAIALAVGMAAAAGCGGAASDAPAGEDADRADAAAAAGVPGGMPIPGGAPALTSEQQREQVQIYMELQTIEQQLGPIRDRAIAQPDLAEREQALLSRMERAMEAASPGILEKKTRYDSLVTLYEGARQGDVDANLQAIGAELEGLQMDLEHAQQEAFAGEDLRQEMEAFRDAVFARMREIDPAADALFSRGDELNARLDSLIGGGN